MLTIHSLKNVYPSTNECRRAHYIDNTETNLCKDDTDILEGTLFFSKLEAYCALDKKIYC